MPTYETPGVYQQDIFPQPEPIFLTGVPVFLGYTERGPVDDNQNPIYHQPVAVTLWPQFEAIFGLAQQNRVNYLAYAARGFFENGGVICYVVRLKETSAREALNELQAGLAAIAALEQIDLVCAPDLVTLSESETEIARLQREVLAHCRRLGDRLAILDPVAKATTETGSQYIAKLGRQRETLVSAYGALYHTWIQVSGFNNQPVFVPPCGHLAGIYARNDQQVGSHKAPANEIIEGALDLQVHLSQAEQKQLYLNRINCLRALTGRGIRVWGARTLSDDPAWLYVNVRRLFLTVGRWVERFMTGVVFETNDLKLWIRIERELNAYLTGLFRQGALRGRTAAESFYVQCDAQTNPPEVREAGLVITEIGLAPVIPNEFVIIRLIHGASGVTITGPIRPG